LISKPYKHASRVQIPLGALFLIELNSVKSILELNTSYGKDIFHEVILNLL